MTTTRFHSEVDRVLHLYPVYLLEGALNQEALRVRQVLPEVLQGQRQDHHVVLQVRQVPLEVLQGQRQVHHVALQVHQVLPEVLLEPRLARLAVLPEALRAVQVPALVIHGKADPLVRIEAGIATHKALPNSELMLIDGMGHDMPEPLWKQVVDGIDRLTSR